MCRSRCRVSLVSLRGRSRDGLILGLRLCV